MKHGLKCTLWRLGAFSQPILVCCYITFTSTDNRELFLARWISELCDDRYLYCLALFCFAIYLDDPLQTQSGSQSKTGQDGLDYSCQKQLFGSRIRQPKRSEGNEGWGYLFQISLPIWDLGTIWWRLSNILLLDEQPWEYLHLWIFVHTMGRNPPAAYFCGCVMKLQTEWDRRSLWRVRERSDR